MACIFFPLALGFFIYIDIIIYSTSPTLLLPMTTTMVEATATFILSPLDFLGSVYHCTALVWLLGCDWKERETGEKALLRMPTHTFARTPIYYWMRGVPVTVYIFISSSPPTLETHTPTVFTPTKYTQAHGTPSFSFFNSFFFFASASSGDIGCALGVQTV